MPQGRNRPSPFLQFTRKWGGRDQLVMTVLAVMIGGLVGLLAIGFMELIDLFQRLFWRISGEQIAAHISALPVWQIILIPTLGGLLVGLFLNHLMPGGKPKGPADVIASCEVGGARMSLREGVLAALASAMSIGAGASVGREGPAVHMGATFAAWVGEKLALARSNSRVLLGCGVAAAVSASFNAPIAGALFAQEVILSHYALKAFAPVVIASVTGTVVSRQVLGNETAFALSGFELGSYWEFPAFVGLGILCGLSAVLFIKSILRLQDKVALIPGPVWIKPAMGGFLVGCIALFFPEVLGVGYEATDKALKGEYAFAMLIGLFFFKFLATVISQGFGFAGGVFSPGLVVGVMLGGAYGILAHSVFPELSSGPEAYSMIGMAAMGAAVLGAPISTTLIVFEFTGDYTLTIGVMCACVMAILVTDQMGRQSFFLEQLKKRGLDLRNYSSVVLSQVRVEDILKREGSYVNIDASLKTVRRKLARSATGVLFVIAHDRSLYGAISWQQLPEDILEGEMDEFLIAADLADKRPPVLETKDTLEVAKAVIDESGFAQIAVVSAEDGRPYLGCIDEREVIVAYNEELLKLRRQEKGAT